MSAGPHGYELLHVETRAAWRRWLEQQHATAAGVWVVSWRPRTGKPRVDYDALVEEALCFGWIDGRTSPLDDERVMQLLTPRKRGSAWAASNKARIARLETAGLLADVGRRAVETAKADGSWTRYDSAEALEIPPDLAAALAASPAAAQRAFAAFTDAATRAVLRGLIDARRPETRTRRIAEAVELALQKGRGGT